MKNQTQNSMIKLELTPEELTDIRALLDEKLHHAETAVAMAERDGNQDAYDIGQDDVCTYEDLALAFADVSINRS